MNRRGRATAPHLKGVSSTAKTSTEAKARWNAKTYKRYQVYFQLDGDRDLIAFIESSKGKYGTSDIFRAAIEKLKNEGLS